ncbi:MAG: hypothetical protein KGJ62_01170 [Armatimonadetes bacterium]|nr:hypothetical protein [Armatimonadota bacterium]MDE2207500.1 hypothetical protein [Armatimonadota bacterium]
MSLPDRIYRIAKGKLDEIKDRFDRVDSEYSHRDAETAARAELSEALDPERRANAAAASAPRRTPQEIAAGLPPGAARTVEQDAAPLAPVLADSDPLNYHYRLLGVEPGSDFAAVTSAYQRLVIRCDSSRFAAESDEARQAAEIRRRLDASFQVLRDALDPTTRRFDMLEFDAAPDVARPASS